MSATEQGYVETWSVPPPGRPATDERPALDWHGSLWGYPATALCVRGERMAWFGPDGSATAATVRRTWIRALALATAPLGLAFLDPHDTLLAWDRERLFLHDPSDGRLLASAPLAAGPPVRVAVHSAEGLILVRSPGRLRALSFGTEGRTTMWETGVSGSGAVCAGDFEARPVVVTYDENSAELVVLDGAGGAVLVRAAAQDPPDQLLAARETGVFLARTGGLVHRLDLLS